MNQYFNNIIREIFYKYNINSILIAISGGQDSICLIKLIENLNHFEPYLKKIEYIYIDHQWKSNSKNQIEHIINYFKHIKNKLYIYQIQKITLSENISRAYRYHIIINHAIKHHYQSIITAHTQTDKIETFLYNLSRGTSLEGITSLNFYRRLNKHLNFFRPLVIKNRIELNFFCRQFFLPIWSDISNYNYSIKRNRIRNEIIPYFIKYLNKNSEYNLNKFLNICYYDNEYIKQKVIKLYIYSKHNTYIALNYTYINQEHITIQTRVFQLFFFHNFYIIINKKFLMKLINYINQKNQQNYIIIQWQYINLNINHKWIYITLNCKINENKYLMIHK
uniref:tRNA(Ile)-lysidine synthase n=1 Tax=Apoglossum ruscifolium TaxID=167976 RepID=A0A4D6WQL5_9FLOR|nr:tRNA Ile-lysidine synthetase [Apoglossum ruscifolium]